MDARALGQLLDNDNHSICLHSSPSQLFGLAFWAIYLVILRFLAAAIRSFNINPECLHAHLIRVETRIVDIAISVVQVLPGETAVDKYRGGFWRDDIFRRASSPSPAGLADDVIAPRSSSLDSGGSVPGMLLQQPKMAYLRPQAPRPPFHRNSENFNRQASPWLPPPLGTTAINILRRDLVISPSLDGTMSPPSVIEPIPRTPLPPIPTFFISQMPATSMSDSIYSSSCSTHHQQQQQLFPAQPECPGDSSNSSMGQKPSAETQAYTDILLPKRSFDDDAKSNPTSFSGTFSSCICQDLERKAMLAAMAQQYARMSRRRSRSLRVSSTPNSSRSAKNWKGLV